MGNIFLSSRNVSKLSTRYIIIRLALEVYSSVAFTACRSPHFKEQVSKWEKPGTALVRAHIHITVTGNTYDKLCKFSGITKHS